MPEQLYLAANLARSSLVFGHLQIVYEDADGNLAETESTSPGFPYFWGDWVFPEFGRRHDDGDNTPGYGDPDDYAIVPLTLLPGQTAKYVWELLGQVHQSISTGGFGIDYDVEQNSNSYAMSLLSVVGISIAGYLDAITPPSVVGFPGVGTNILFGAKTGGLFSDDDTPIPLTLAGTSGNDRILTGIGDDVLEGADGNDRIHAGAGDDDVRGGRGRDLLIGAANDDYLRGQSGNDTLKGGSGADTLEGQSGKDLVFGDGGADLLFGNNHDDTLSGGSGDDTLDGQQGWDIMTGGDGADSFRFSRGRDEITDFDPDVDTILIWRGRVGGTGSGQDIVDSFGRIESGYAVLDFGSDELWVANVADLQELAENLLIY